MRVRVGVCVCVWAAVRRCARISKVAAALRADDALAGHRNEIFAVDTNAAARARGVSSPVAAPSQCGASPPLIAPVSEAELRNAGTKVRRLRSATLRVCARRNGSRRLAQYMGGRISLERVNAAIEEIQRIVDAKYRLLAQNRTSLLRANQQRSQLRTHSLGHSLCNKCAAHRLSDSKRQQYDAYKEVRRAGLCAALSCS